LEKIVEPLKHVKMFLSSDVLVSN